MNKTGHIFLTGKYLPKELEKYRKWILLGTVMPDILIHTYAKLHTWNKTSDMIFKNMQRLGEKGMGGWYSWFRFGYNLHYIEDYFTYPHNVDMDLATHVCYEKKFTDFIKSEQDRQYGSDMEKCSQPIDNVEKLIENIKILHEKYSRGWSGFEKDEIYMTAAVNSMYKCYEKVFEKNRHEMLTFGISANEAVE